MSFSSRWNYGLRLAQARSLGCALQARLAASSAVTVQSPVRTFTSSQPRHGKKKDKGQDKGSAKGKVDPVSSPAAGNALAALKDSVVVLVRKSQALVQDAGGGCKMEREMERKRKRESRSRRATTRVPRITMAAEMWPGQK